MIILGVILLILGFVFGISILWMIGIILIVVGAVLTILGATAGPSVAAKLGTECASRTTACSRQRHRLTVGVVCQTVVHPAPNGSFLDGRPWYGGRSPAPFRRRGSPPPRGPNRTRALSGGIGAVHGPAVRTSPGKRATGGNGYPDDAPRLSRT